MCVVCVISTIWTVSRSAVKASIAVRHCGDHSSPLGTDLGRGDQVDRGDPRRSVGGHGKAVWKGDQFAIIALAVFQENGPEKMSQHQRRRMDRLLEGE
jgi:hypothetical protein